MDSGTVGHTGGSLIWEKGGSCAWNTDVRCGGQQVSEGDIWHDGLTRARANSPSNFFGCGRPDAVDGQPVSDKPLKGEIVRFNMSDAFAFVCLLCQCVFDSLVILKGAHSFWYNKCVEDLLM